MKASILSWGLVVGAALFDSYAAFVVKLKFNQLGKIDLSSLSSFLQYMTTFLKSPLLLSAIVTFCLAPGLWFLALNRLELSSAYPVLVGIHLLCVLLFGVGVLGEQLTVSKAIGTGLVFVAMYLFHR